MTERTEALKREADFWWSEYRRLHALPVSHDESRWIEVAWRQARERGEHLDKRINEEN